VATCSDAVSVTSADGTSIALHELSPATSSNSSSPVLFSHATGFHAHCWQPIADVLRAEWRLIIVALATHRKSIQRL